MSDEKPTSKQNDKTRFQMHAVEFENLMAGQKIQINLTKKTDFPADTVDTSSGADRTESSSQDDLNKAVEKMFAKEAANYLRVKILRATPAEVRRTQGLELGYLDWIMRPKDAADARANLEDAFEGWVARHGLAKAQQLYKVQGCRLAAGYVLDRITNRLSQVAKLLRFGF
jgi:hypothetical protein